MMEFKINMVLFVFSFVFLIGAGISKDDLIKVFRGNL